MSGRAIDGQASFARARRQGLVAVGQIEHEALNVIVEVRTVSVVFTAYVKRTITFKKQSKVRRRDRT